VTIAFDELKDKLGVDRRELAAGARDLLTTVNAYKLRELRQQAGLTQVQMALKLKMSQNRVSKIERGLLDKTEVGTIKKYIAALGGDIQISVKINGKVMPLLDFVRWPEAKVLKKSK